MTKASDFARLINHLIDRDPHVAESLARFCGKRFAVQTPQFGLVVSFDESAVRVGPLDADSTADVTIRGSALHLLGMLQDSDRPLADQQLHIEGDAELLLDLQHTARKLDIRWEDHLQPVLGDVLTGGLGSAAAGARDWARQARGNIKRNLANFAQYESGAMPTPEELASFADRVDELRLRADRLQARVEILRRDSSRARGAAAPALARRT